MEKRKRRRFTAEYKAEAVKRLEESGKPLQAVAEELGSPLTKCSAAQTTTMRCG